MEILYIHIKDYNKFKNQDLNFGGKYIFDYNSKQKELLITINELYIDDFFEQDFKDNLERSNITNVTSIIGQNGTGKTSILKIIRDNFPKGHNSIQLPMIFAINNNGKITIYHDENILIEKSNIKEFNFELVLLQKKKKSTKTNSGKKIEYLSNYSIDDFNNTDFIYFSNIFDGTGGLNINGLRDISTNHLVFNDYVNNIEFKNIQVESNKSQLETYIFDDIQRQVFFVNLFKGKSILPFNLPEELFILLKKDYLKDNISGQKLSEKSERTITEIIKKVELTRFTFTETFEKVKYDYIVNLFIGFIIELNYSHNNIIEIIDSGNNILSFKDKVISLDEIFSKLEQFKLLISLQTNLKLLLSTFNSFISLIKHLRDIDIENKNINVAENFISLKISNNNLDEFNSFMDLYINSFIFRPYLNFSWRSLSSGEKALLNIYSRFYSLTPNIQKTEDLKENIIILIDEGDAYLHPEWQKQFVKIILDYIPLIYNKNHQEKKQNIQIIFTTNSPIPASDLLNYNTIFLENFMNEKSEHITIVKDSLNDQKETFAANIHTLLSDSFFVKGGLVGAFASLKINKIIHQLINRIELTFDERDKMRKLIHQIGEPVLKIKLMQMYNDRFNLNIHERLDLIEKKMGI